MEDDIQAQLRFIKYEEHNEFWFAMGDDDEVWVLELHDSSASTEIKVFTQKLILAENQAQLKEKLLLLRKAE